ncbi:unnamed protein product [Aphanomyces euteiches]|uniref:Large ribosomal subunit protein uL18 C-terminal eukaryotes domain-containing protein n=1 Tax=Aphanomyces euteiches TaxID=100861 RepID=A0A6G0WJX1_9STRA|nr:hypothetical protein Ae201684_014376 [Aphanomyces euteiches]KAH9088779.1 hypothetical protein Ae201684P_012993 [Aphanomyces euteiches]KAH9158210.1 hypothetical protein AeRB84_000043 [Aphanomyces euteiches]
MPFVKVTKSKAYFKRYQVKYRRRREGKTDYRARKRLITQDKNKYNSPKYRLVVRITNKRIICQIAYAEIDGDKILTSAYSDELKRYGLKAGFKNYAAAYATGLLVGRRLLNKLGLDGDYEGNTEIDGNVVKTEANGRTYYVAEVADEKRPFRAFLDVGLRTTSTGNRVFGALKGATDAGLDIPHSEKRFPGYDRDAKSYDADVHRERIFGEHIANHMKELEEDDPEMYASHFSQYVAAGVGSDDIEEMYTSVHEAIRADPTPAPKKDFTPDPKFKNKAKRSLQQRKARVAQKKANHAKKLAEASD